MPESTTKYKPEYDHQAYVACTLGAAEQDLANMFKVDRSTIYNWKKTYAEFALNVEKGKDEFDTDKAEKSFLSRVLGTAKSKEVHTFLDHDGKPIKAQTKVIEKTPVPDVHACIFWLTHRNRERWGENKDTVPGKKGNFDKMLEELARKKYE